MLKKRIPVTIFVANLLLNGFEFSGLQHYIGKETSVATEAAFETKVSFRRGHVIQW